MTWWRDGADYEIDLRDGTPEEATEALSGRLLDPWVALATPDRETLDETVSRRCAEKA